MTSRHYLHTGQRTCHADDGQEVPCESSGQDASFAVGTPWPKPRFSLRDDVVTDNLTGLIWCRDASLAEFPFTGQQALNFVATMNREQRFSQHDWRMPNRRELRSMLSPKNTATVVGQKRFAQFSVLVVATVDGIYFLTRMAPCTQDVICAAANVKRKTRMVRTQRIQTLTVFAIPPPKKA